MNEFYTAACKRRHVAATWLIELPDHRYVEDLRDRINTFMTPLVEHETSLECQVHQFPDTIGTMTHEAMTSSLFTFQVGAFAVSSQYSVLRDEVDRMMGRGKRPVVEEQEEQEKQEEEEEEEEPEEDEEENEVEEDEEETIKRLEGERKEAREALRKEARETLRKEEAAAAARSRQRVLQRVATNLEKDTTSSEGSTAKDDSSKDSSSEDDSSGVRPLSSLLLPKAKAKCKKGKAKAKAEGKQSGKGKARRRWKTLEKVRGDAAARRKGKEEPEGKGKPGGKGKEQRGGKEKTTGYGGKTHSPTE